MNQCNGFNPSFSPYKISKAREKAERERKIKEIEEARARVSIDILSEKEQERSIIKHCIDGILRKYSGTTKGHF